MANMLMKLKKDAKREYLTTPSGYTIKKNKFTEVDDKDITIQSFLFNRNDLVFKSVPKKIKDSGVSDSTESFKEEKKEDKA